MRALVYVRTTNCENLVKIIIENCKNFCLENQLEFQDAYFDVGVRPSAPKSRFKGFLELLENIQPNDCIVCERFNDLPIFFRKEENTPPVRFPGEDIADKDLRRELLLKFGV